MRTYTSYTWLKYSLEPTNWAIASSSRMPLRRAAGQAAFNLFDRAAGDKEVDECVEAAAVRSAVQEQYVSGLYLLAVVFDAGLDGLDDLGPGHAPIQDSAPGSNARRLGRPLQEIEVDLADEALIQRGIVVHNLEHGGRRAAERGTAGRTAQRQVERFRALDLAV